MEWFKERALEKAGEGEPLVNKQVLESVRSLLDPERVAYEVHYPRRTDQGMGEARLFEWFVQNDKEPVPQTLRELPEEGGMLPGLETN